MDIVLMDITLMEDDMDEKVDIRSGAVSKRVDLRDGTPDGWSGSFPACVRHRIDDVLAMLIALKKEGWTEFEGYFDDDDRDDQSGPLVIAEVFRPATDEEIARETEREDARRRAIAARVEHERRQRELRAVAELSLLRQGIVPEWEPDPEAVYANKNNGGAK